MLMIRARVHSSSQLPVRRKFWSVSIYHVSVHYSAAENRKNSLKSSILWFKVIQGH